MQKIRLEEWAAVLEAQIAALPAVLNTALEVIGAKAANDAQAMIGEYQPGWAPLAPSTVAEKEYLGYAPPDNPLLREGDMRASIAHGIIGDLRFGAAVLIVGSPSPVALWQEMGTTGGIPPRPFLGRSLIVNEPFIAITIGEAMAALLGKLAP